MILNKIVRIKLKIKKPIAFKLAYQNMLFETAYEK